MDQFPTPPRFRFTLPIAALIGFGTMSLMVGIIVFLALVVADILLTPALWVLSRLLHRTKLPPAAAQCFMWLPWLGIAALTMYYSNGYLRERSLVQMICNGRPPAELNIIDSDEIVGFDVGVFQATIRTSAVELQQMLALPPFVLTEKPGSGHPNFMSRFRPPFQPGNLRYYVRDDWRKESGHTAKGWIITDDTFAWAYLYYYN